jgi:phenylacetic acid degradation operon negative regulatory protein
MSAQASELEAKGVIDSAGASFVTYLDVIDHWRRLPLRDPGLPRELLLPEGWSAPLKP